MNELTIPFKIKIKIGKSENKYPMGEFIVKAKYKISLAIGICWLSFKIFLVGIKTFINYKE